MYMQYGCSYQRLLYCTCRCTSTCTCTRTTCILNNLVGVHVQVHVHVHVMYKFTCTCTCMECTEFSKYTCKYYRMGGINQMQLQKYRYLSVLLDCTGTFLQLVRLPFDVYRPEFGKNCKVCCAIGKNLRVKLLFFSFSPCCFQEIVFIRDFPYMDWKELRLVATINSLPHFDWKHAVLTLVPEYQVQSSSTSK